MARLMLRPRRGSVYRLKLASMFRFQALSSPSQCHQFRSPAWKTVWPPAATRKASPSSVEGRASTLAWGRSSVSPPRRFRHFSAVSGERPQRLRFRGESLMSWPRTKRTSRVPSSRENILGSKWSGWAWLAKTYRGTMTA